MSSYLEPLERDRWFVDADGVVATSKHPDEVLKVPIDWTDALVSGETVSTSTWQNASGGLTTSSEALATPVATVFVTGTGSVENEITTSLGQTLIRKRRFYDNRGPKIGTDYGV